MKPVQGPDGNRVPLLRPGFRPTSSYTVSFVFMHSGSPFAKKGGAELSLPSMDIPISLLNWEVFLPEQYKVKDFGGDVIAANRVPEPFREEDATEARRGHGIRSRTNGGLRHRSEWRDGCERTGHHHFSGQRRDQDRSNRRKWPLAGTRDVVGKLQS